MWLLFWLSLYSHGLNFKIYELMDAARFRLNDKITPNKSCRSWAIHTAVIYLIKRNYMNQVREGGIFGNDGEG